MKLSFSNIAWDFSQNDDICKMLKEYHFSGIEIAPTIISTDPFTKNVSLVKNFSDSLSKKYDFTIPSMQSIWFGRTENIFNPSDVDMMIDYTKKIIDLANTINCPNLVFGCPKNRNMPAPNLENQVIPFFKAIGDYAFQNNTCVALEANPVIYNTNFINTTSEAFSFAQKVDSNGLKVNVDLGTIIYNNEPLELLSKNPGLINHIHISEPNLAPIEKRSLHQELYRLLKEIDYQKFVSVEMKNPEKTDIIEDTAKYISEIFV